MVDRIDYRAVVADLKARRTRLDNLIAEYQALIVGKSGGGPPPNGTTSPGPDADLEDIHPDTFFGLGIKEASMKYLKMAGRAQHTKTIGEALGQGGLRRPSDNSLFSILVRAAKGREVVKVGKGMWGLADWYPKRPKLELADAIKRKRKSPTKRKSKAAEIPVPARKQLGPAKKAITD